MIIDDKRIVNNNRLLELDQAKGMAIFLVIYTHCIQYICRGDGFDNIIYQGVYTFHMPLFMIISGYLFHSKMNVKIKSVFISQFKHLILPAVFLGGIVTLLCGGNINIVTLAKMPLICWFLGNLFATSIFYLIGNRFIKDIRITTVLLSISILLIPESYGCYFLKFFIPFFGFGLCLKKYGLLEIKIKRKVFLLFALVSLLICALVWDKSYYVYITPPLMKISNIIVHIIRFVVGSLLSILIILGFRQMTLPVRINKLLSNLSYNSMALYVCHYIFLTNISKYYYLQGYKEYENDIISLVSAILITCLLTYLINKIRNNKTFSFIVTGKINGGA